MDQDENKEKSNPSPSKNKKKSHGLCNILALRKKRVGCLPVSSDNSVDSDECSGYARRNVQNVDTLAIFTTSPHKLDKKCVSEDNPLYENEDNLISKRSEAALAKSNSTTNIALCCAITESSRTPLHFQPDFKIRYDNMKATGNINRRSILTRMNGHHSEELHDKLPPTGLESKLIKPSSDTNISNVRKTDAIRRSLFSSKNKKTHKRSFSLGKTVFSSEDNKSKDSEKTCIGSSQSCEISPQSSPSPVETSHTRLRRRLLLSQRRSADNIVASSSGSSPVSTRSVPDSKEKKKIRPSSVILLSGQEDKGKKSRDASMDSLARQSLLAAQVLHLIPTDKARERNFLHGRIAANSLLGSLELERVLPQREVRIYIATWNMNGQAPPAELNSLVLPEGLDHLPDILAIGTQESYPERFQWEVSIQETLGPSHVLFHSAALGTLHLAIYMRRDLLWFCSVAEDSSYSVRPGTAFRTKGAVAIGFSLFGTTFLFITAHLTAHQDKVKERLQDIKRIAKSLELPKLLPLKHKNKDVTQNFDCVFWSGDLNFRLTQPREEVLSWISSQQFPLSSPPKVDCLPDQLTTSILDGTIFRGFEEGPLTFAPTYKYDPGSQTFDSSHKQRTPSYTDRILFKSRKNSSADNSVILVCLSYASVPSVCTSDHKPVWGLYKCVVRPGIDTIPLAAGMFNREVYLEAIKRRAAEMDLRGSTSAICTIQ